MLTFLSPVRDEFRWVGRKKGAGTTATEEAVAWRVGRRLEGWRGWTYVRACVGNGERRTANEVDRKDRHGSEVEAWVSARKDVRCAET